MTDEELRVVILQKREAEMLKNFQEELERMKPTDDEIAQEFFFSNLSDETRLADFCFNYFEKIGSVRRGKIEESYDILMINEKIVCIVEVKYNAHEKDLKKLERKMRNFKKLFPIYEAYKLYGAIASFHINDDAKEAALNQGFFVLQRSGDLIHTDAAENLMVL